MGFKQLLSVCLSIIIRAVSQTVEWASHLTTWIHWSALNHWQADLWASWHWRMYTAPHSTTPHAQQATNQHIQTHTLKETAKYLLWHPPAVLECRRFNCCTTHKFLLLQKDVSDQFSLLSEEAMCERQWHKGEGEKLEGTKAQKQSECVT